MENQIVFVQRCCFYLSFKIEEDNVSMCQFVPITMYNIPLIQIVQDKHFQFLKLLWTENDLPQDKQDLKTYRPSVPLHHSTP